MASLTSTGLRAMSHLTKIFIRQNSAKSLSECVDAIITRDSYVNLFIWRIFLRRRTTQLRWRAFVVVVHCVCSIWCVGMYQLTNFVFPLRPKWDISINQLLNRIRPICRLEASIFSSETRHNGKMACGISTNALSMFVLSLGVVSNAK